MDGLSTHAFTMEDQQAFAALSGDYNPMHMDARAARRTPAGACVVHGVQSMLWALERVGDIVPLARLKSLDADFARFLYPGERVTLGVISVSDAQARVELRVDEARVSHLILGFGVRPPASAHVDAPVHAGTVLHYERHGLEPLPLEWEQVANASGTVPHFVSDAAVSRAYPALAATLGAPRVNAILCLTRLVGMVSPGLHSTFHRIKVAFPDGGSSEPDAADSLSFETRAADPRFQLVTIAVRGAGLEGTVTASRRSPPTAQATSSALAGTIGAGRFAGNVALVIGGSRGLGELTAKLLGLAGVETIVSFATGEAEAEAVAGDIVSAGGRARTFQLDVLGDLEEQLARLPVRPGSVYYFATSRISRRPSERYQPELYQGFSRIYVDAFHAVCRILALPAGGDLQVFYPSSVFVETPVKGMTEYAMAKAAGEVMAGSVTRFMKGVTVEFVRLPRVATDQTAGMIEQELSPALEQMLPVVERIEGRAAGTRD